jgi:hypothetical protein
MTEKVAVGTALHQADKICSMRAAAPTAPVSTATSSTSAIGKALRCPVQHCHTAASPPSPTAPELLPGTVVPPPLLLPSRVPRSSLRDFPPEKQRHPELCRPRFSDGFSSRSRSRTHFW